VSTFLDTPCVLILLLVALLITLVHSVHSQIRLYSHCCILHEKGNYNQLLKSRDDDLSQSELLHCDYFGRDAVQSDKLLTNVMKEVLCGKLNLLLSCGENLPYYLVIGPVEK
jgi:hypothetical protein